MIIINSLRNEKKRPKRSQAVNTTNEFQRYREKEKRKTMRKKLVIAVVEEEVLVVEVVVVKVVA